MRFAVRATVAAALGTAVTVPATVWAQSEMVPQVIGASARPARAKQGLAALFTGTRPKQPYSVTLSSYSPDGKSIGNGVGAFPSLTVNYDTAANTSLGGPTRVGFYADLNSGGRYSRGNSAEYDFSTVGLGLQARRDFTKSLEKRHFYAGLGLGLYSTEYTVDPVGPARYRKTQFGTGIRLFGGYTLAKQFSLQIDLLSLDPLTTRNANGFRVKADPSGTRLGIGYHF